jgi:hypothetical protein
VLFDNSAIEEIIGIDGSVNDIVYNNLIEEVTNINGPLDDILYGAPITEIPNILITDFGFL